MHRLAERVRDYLVPEGQRPKTRARCRPPQSSQPTLAMSISRMSPIRASPDWPDDDDDSDEAEIKRDIWTRVMGAVSKAAQAGAKAVQAIARRRSGDEQADRVHDEDRAKPRKAISMSPPTRTRSCSGWQCRDEQARNAQLRDRRRLGTRSNETIPWKGAQRADRDRTEGSARHCEGETDSPPVRRTKSPESGRRVDLHSEP